MTDDKIRDELPRTKDFKKTILNELNDGPKSGYEIADSLTDKTGTEKQNFYRRVLRTLKKLEEQGKVKSKIGKGGEGPIPPKLYRRI